ncbi:L,D-transpeptidase [Gloeothece citriformis]|uniref:L,D-transpeptidase n=1 Tax=Gloeothece citriformis TaxID=2546356 RepID=UPI001EF072DC|nr:L,D-transpeptidase [Gloeothece citriformis]
MPIEEKTPLPVEEVPTQPSNVEPPEKEAIIIEPEIIPEEIETRLVLKLRERRVYVYQGDQEIGNYPVAVGKKGWETPTGDFAVMQMIVNPSWQNPWNGRIVPAGPKNPLGERWIGFWTDGKNFIGFHGTAAEHLIGQAVSHGCVRMRNSDIKALYEHIKLGTSVVVVP